MNGVQTHSLNVCICIVLSVKIVRGNINHFFVFLKYLKLTFCPKTNPRKPMQEQIYQQFSSLVALIGIAKASPRLIIIIINREKIENLLWNIYMYVQKILR